MRLAQTAPAHVTNGEVSGTGTRAQTLPHAPTVESRGQHACGVGREIHLASAQGTHLARGRECGCACGSVGLDVVDGLARRRVHARVALWHVSVAGEFARKPEPNILYLEISFGKSVGRLGPIRVLRHTLVLVDSTSVEVCRASGR